MSEHLEHLLEGFSWHPNMPQTSPRSDISFHSFPEMPRLSLIPYRVKVSGQYLTVLRKLTGEL
jgi:hypothetical protein